MVPVANVSSNFKTNIAAHYANAYTSVDGETECMCSPGPSKFMGDAMLHTIPARIKM